MIILGIDPGSYKTGYGIIETNSRTHQLIAQGVLKTTRRFGLPERLRQVHEGVVNLIAQHSPDILAVEDVFHRTNTKTALVLSHVRGVILLAGASAGLPVHEFSPATVKVQVTGFGRAERAQVAMMVNRLLNLPGESKPGDAADALAVALCEAHLVGSPENAVR